MRIVPAFLLANQSAETGTCERAYHWVGCRPRPCQGLAREEPRETWVQCDKLRSIFLHAH